MSAVGFSDTKPLIDPQDPKSVQMNRRVDVVVLTQLTAEQAALLPAAAGEDAKLHAGATTSSSAAEQTTGTTTTTAAHD
jgi:chemotaxis protein MotB